MAHTITYLFVLVHSMLGYYIPIYHYIPVHTFCHEYVQGHTFCLEYVPGTYRYILEEKGAYSRGKVHTLGYKYILFGSHTGMYRYVPVHTLVLHFVLLFFDFQIIAEYILLSY